MAPQALKVEDQLDLFFRRGMILTDKKKHLEKMKHISYYRLKEFAQPYSKVTMYGEIPVIRYADISFDDVVKRYYQDKNLRIHLMHAIEKIEVSLKRNLSYILGKKYGAYGYLDFSLWANKEKKTRFQLEEEQYKFKRDLLKTVRKSSLSELREEKNLNEDGFPSIWLASEILMFGNLIHLIKLMSSKNQKELAGFYNCKVTELLSWLKCLNFVRNICAHNSNVIDINLKTKPVIRSNWNEGYLYTTTDRSGGNLSTNRLAVIILIVTTLVHQINEKYKLEPIRSSLASICRASDPDKGDKNAHLIGFANSSGALDLETFTKGKKRKKRRKQKVMKRRNY